MNISLVKQEKIRRRVLDKIPEIIEARKLKKEIAKIITTEARNSLSPSEKYMSENYPNIMHIYHNAARLYIDGTGFCDNPIASHSYWSWTKEYRDSEIFKEVYFCKPVEQEKYFNDIFNGCPFIIHHDCSGILDIIKDDETKQVLIDLVTRFVNCLREAERKMSKLNTILCSKEIGLNDIKNYSPKLYNIIKLEL